MRADSLDVFGIIVGDYVVNIRSVSSAALALLLCASLSLVPAFVGDSFAATPRKCKSQDFNYKNALKRERTAESDVGKADRTLQSLQVRYERDLQKKERTDENCVNKVDRLNDSFTQQLNNAEAARQRYHADITQMRIQRIACEFDLATGGACNVNRFISAIARLGKQVVRAELRIDTLRKLLSQKLQTQQDVCRREALRNVTTIARSLGRVTAAQPKLAARQAVLATAKAAREVAEAALAQCQATP